jgi:hypothetical protein
MKYSAEKEQFQKVFGGILKRKYKCIKSVNVDDEEFEESFDSEGWAPSFNVYVEWNVREALEYGESFENLSSLGSEILYNMFKKRAVPWIKLKSNFLD